MLLSGWGGLANETWNWRVCPPYKPMVTQEHKHTAGRCAWSFSLAALPPTPPPHCPTLPYPAPYCPALPCTLLSYPTLRVTIRYRSHVDRVHFPCKDEACPGVVFRTRLELEVGRERHGLLVVVSTARP